MNIPILIPIKAISRRCQEKNYILLPYTLDWLKKLGYIKNVIIITDSKIFKHITDKYNIKEYYLENREWDSDLISIKKYLLKHSEIDEYIHLPVTQPLRDNKLIERVIQLSNKTQYDVITSYNQIPNRFPFLLNEDCTEFVYKGVERKGSLCAVSYCADGAIYLSTRTFITSLKESINKSFWNSNIKFVENKAPFLDIDTEEDLHTFVKYFTHDK